MRIFKHRSFHQWAKYEDLTDTLLTNAIKEIEEGLFETHLGGGLYKKRIPKKGYGKSSGYRTIIAYKRSDRGIFMYGFAKNERENISIKEKDIYKKLAKYYLHATDSQLNTLIKNNELIEITQ